MSKIRWVVGVAAGLWLPLVGVTAAASASLEEVRQLAGEQRTYEALKQLDEFLVERPANTEGLLLKGVLLTGLGRSDEAKQIFLELSQKVPDRPEPYNNLAAIYGAAGDYDQAIQVLKLALRTHPSYGTAYENLTKVYGRLASEAYDRALGREVQSPSEPVELALLSEIGGSQSGLTIAARPAAGGPSSGAVAPRPEPSAPPPVVAAPPAEATGSAPGGEPASAAAERIAAEPVEPPAALPESPPAPAVVAAPEESEAEMPGPDFEAEVAEPATEPPPEPEPAGGLEGVRETVRAWAAAWSSQRADDYLGFYSEQFVPSGGDEVEEWRAQRRERLSSPRFIEVSVAMLDAGRDGPDRAWVRFLQSYRSNRYEDTVTKTLDLVREAGGWKILAERVEE